MCTRQDCCGTHLFLCPVRVPGIDQGDDAGEQPRGGAHEQCRDVVETKSSRQGGEEGVERETDDICRKGEHHDVDLDILDGQVETVEDTLFGRVCISFSNVLNHAELRNLSLLLGEASRVVWEIGEDDGRRDRNSHRDSSFDPEQPTPGCVAQYSLHIGQDASSNERREGVGDEVSAEQDGVASSQLSARVPLGKDQESTGEEGGLDESKEKPNENHADKVVDDSGEGRDETPEKHGARDVQRRSADPIDEHVGRDLHENVADVKNTQTCRVFCIVELQVLLETFESCRRDVVAIQVVHDVDQNEKSAPGIQLSLQLLLNDLSVNRVHGKGASRMRLLGPGLEAGLAVHMPAEGLRRVGHRDFVMTTWVNCKVSLASGYSSMPNKRIPRARTVDLIFRWQETSFFYRGPFSEVDGAKPRACPMVASPNRRWVAQKLAKNVGNGDLGYHSSPHERMAIGLEEPTILPKQPQ